MPLFSKVLPEDKVAALLRDKVVEHEGKRFVIREVLRMRRLEPEDWIPSTNG